MKTLGIKWIVSVLSLPLGLFLIGLTGWGGFGLLSVIALPLAILYTFEFSAELRQQRGRLARTAGCLLAVPKLVFALTAIVIGIGIALWVLYNLLIERQPEFRGGSVGVIIALLAFGLLWLSRLFRKPVPAAAEDVGFWFRCDGFVPEPGEDVETNPGIHGRQLALWLHDRFAGLGYAVEPPIAEDWGWCVVCLREPIMAWVGCGGHFDAEAGALPVPGEIDWHCFVEVESPPWRTGFARGVDKTALKQRLHAQLREILIAEPGLRLTPAS